MIRPAKPVKAKMAFTGVRRVGCTLPSQDGSRPSRPALKMSRHWEFTAEISTPRVEVMPAKKAKKAKAARAPCATVMNGISALPTLAVL
jgi:hypothetical protein